MFHELPPVMRWSLVVVTASALAISLARLGRHSLTRQATGLHAADCETETGHVVMLASMLVMFAAPNAPVPVGTWRVVFTAALICYGVLLVIRAVQWRAQAPADRRKTRIFAAGHHFVMAAAMLYMTSASKPTPATPHKHHADLPWPVLAWTLVVVLTADALRQVLVAATRRAPGLAATKLPPSIRVAFVPPTVMDAAMAMMLVAML
jgi:hypothetical protein